MQAIRTSVKADKASGARLCRLLASNGINIAYSAMGATQEHFSCLCCIADQDLSAARALIEQDHDLKQVLDFLPAVGLVNLFPHQHRFQVFGQALKALTGQQIEIHSLASSLSALSFVIDFHRMPDAQAALGRYFQKM
jgi:aspartokinase